MAALAGAAAVVARKFLGKADADWQAARPSAPYTPPQPATTASEPVGAATVDEAGVPEDQAAASVDAVTVSDESMPAADVSEAAAEDIGTPAQDFAAPPGDSDVADSLGDESTDTLPSEANQASLVYSTESEGAAESSAESSPTDTSEAASPEQSRYQSEGVYIGQEPPEGYTIKGNERSKKYHVPGSVGYTRTAGDVWFNSVEAAERVGFVRAQR